MRSVVMLSLVLLMTVPVRAQTPVLGYVLSLDSGEMLAGANVRLLDASGLPLASRPALQTEEDGRFLFEDVSAGAYMLGFFGDNQESAQVLVLQGPTPPGPASASAVSRYGGLQLHCRHASGRSIRTKRVGVAACCPVRLAHCAL